MKMHCNALAANNVMQQQQQQTGLFHRCQGVTGVYASLFAAGSEPAPNQLA